MNRILCRWTSKVIVAGHIVSYHEQTVIEILVYDIHGLYAKHNLEENIDWLWAYR